MPIDGIHRATQRPVDDIRDLYVDTIHHHFPNWKTMSDAERRQSITAINAELHKIAPKIPVEELEKLGRLMLSGVLD
jgi:hypothetical protein